MVNLFHTELKIQASAIRNRKPFDSKPFTSKVIIFFLKQLAGWEEPRGLLDGFGRFQWDVCGQAQHWTPVKKANKYIYLNHTPKNILALFLRNYF